MVADSSYPTGRHYEVSEDGHKYEHNGYTEKRCQGCGKLFLIAKDVRELFDTCGQEGCKEA